ncbi:hypothetical protein [Sanguibacter sp. HDW7]|uniref:DUF7937 domain-containing protein n=1 Tax=Sanguibacter sp. HDW7 TaxID=2714931 RepID=UPI00140E4A26|nr:hypothetical protein [Sanguibacter sp. HDW7]QIK83806.1 hypothetical protein G7063_09355 [Sanguibacter sp. HDW7]
MDVNAGGTPLEDTPGAAPAVEAGPRGRFHDMTDGDHVRDLLGVLAIVLALQLTWSSAGGAAEVPWALAALLVLVVPLTLPYLARLGALPATWTVHSTRRARVVLALPAVAASLAQVVLDAAAVDGQRGLGPGVAIGLAAAALAAVPRSSELGPAALDAAVSRSWRSVTTLVGALAVLAPVAWLVLLVVQRLQVPSEIRAEDDLTRFLVVAAVSTVLVVGALVLPSVLAAFTRTALWRRAAVVVAATWAVALFAANDASVSVESVRTLTMSEVMDDTVVVAGVAVLGYGLVLVGALAVLATSPAVVRASKDEGDPAIGWFVTARGLLGLVAALASVVAVVTLVIAIDDNQTVAGAGLATSPGLGVLVPGAVVALVVGGVALKVRSMLVGRPADARRPAIVATAALLVVGIFLVVVSRLDVVTAFVPQLHVTLLTLVVGVGLPVAVLACLTLPSSVRAHVAANPATPRPGGTSTAYVWEPRSTALSAAPSAPSAPAAPGYPQAPAPQGYPQEAPAYDISGSATAAAQPVGHDQPVDYGQPVADATYGAAPVETPVAGYPVSTSVQAGPVEPLPFGAEQPAVVAEQPAVVTEQPVVVDAPAATSAEPTVPAGDQVTEVLRLDVADPSTRTEAGFTWAQAIDGQTPATTLAQIAQDAPTLRAALAANPSTYLALLEWLGQLGDAEIDEALRSRTA